MKQPKHFVSCDWGTSNFRIRLIDFDTLEVIKEHKTEMGVKKLYQQFLSSESEDQQAYFSEYLISQLTKVTDLTEQIVIVACGMITSSIGLKELSYSEVPFENESLNIEKLQLTENIDLLLISGVKTTEDVMRGEEVQALGMTEFLEEDCYLLLPGTHSKHLLFSEGQYQTFRTFMTGELFELISSQSILKDSIQKVDFTDEAKKSFVEGVRKGINGWLTSSLFSIRAKQVQNQSALGKIEEEIKTSNFYLLSGLLIGDELSYLKDQKLPIKMAASGVLSLLYTEALKVIEGVDFQTFEDGVLEYSLINGQKLILKNYIENEYFFSAEV
ncbi:2-dehydro-3-deoxygalactonokinase [Flammeovirga sp. MY04]|uniref:2-dehydro-3-deoxygalactonokinase n=1 Tax=Flammeovirga sp. MY04 TaxID=1191459 RepID=UPI0008061E8B|nr:2-dehydro-3-deoxygalactonokinase [Flammeovirga sp. MY04]ANQ52381.1 2-dehydro-3-deoxygalactonokinase [Flammeovirga sp. MY04]